MNKEISTFFNVWSRSNELKLGQKVLFLPDIVLSMSLELVSDKFRTFWPNSMNAFCNPTLWYIVMENNCFWFNFKYFLNCYKNRLLSISKAMSFPPLLFRSIFLSRFYCFECNCSKNWNLRHVAVWWRLHSGDGVRRREKRSDANGRRRQVRRRLRGWKRPHLRRHFHRRSQQTSLGIAHACQERSVVKSGGKNYELARSAHG